MKILLDEKDFRTLTAGGIVKKKSNDTIVEIMLSDIGYILMQNIIDEQTQDLCIRTGGTDNEWTIKRIKSC